MVWLPWYLMEETWTLLSVSFQSRQLSGTEQSSHTYDSKEIPFHISKDPQLLGNWLIYVVECQMYCIDSEENSHL